MSEQTITVGGQELTVRLVREGGTWKVGTGKDEVSVEVVRLGESDAVLRVNGRQVMVPFVRESGTVHFVFEGITYRAEIAGKGRGRRGRHVEGSLSAPMPGVVLKISVKAGDVVRRGAPLMVLEAMKMEHQISAPYDGEVRAVHCREGQLVQPGVDLIELKASDDKKSE